MPEESSRSIKLKRIKVWLKRLDQKSDNDYAREFLSGKTVPPETSPEGLPAGKPEPGFFRRISDRLRGSSRFIKKRRGGSAATGGASSDGAQLEQRLAGMETLRPVPGALPQKPKKTGPLPQETPQRAPVTLLETQHTIPGRFQAQGREADFEDLRPQVAQVYETSVEEASRPGIPILRRLRDWFYYLPTTQKILLGCMLLILVAGVVVLAVVFTRPAHPAVATSPQTLLDPSIPVPASVTLPGGQTFKLAVGSLADGQWTPKGPEWLAGTEVPRWLALPSSSELEKAVKTFKVDDLIRLTMSNGDQLAYRFQSLQKVPLGGLAVFQANTADLLIVLWKQNSTTLSVIVALP